MNRIASIAATVAVIITGLQNSAMANENIKTAIFAGGCFWCVESDFDNVKGVVATTSGYIGGEAATAHYKLVSAGGSGHREAVRITYDTSVTSYNKLLNVFWRSVDPTDSGGQFCDRGFSYSTAVYYTDAKQKKIAEASKRALATNGKPGAAIVTPIIAATPFHPAESYHLDYASRNPLRYNFYRFRCGRDKQVKALWGDEAHAGIEKH